jgi:acyl-CoA synthetase (AMP-forming)/AMP-acid ligase II
VGHSYSVYGPLLMGCTTLMYEGKPVGTPDASNFWRVIERHKVHTLFTAPTALRSIKRVDEEGELAKKFDLSSLRTVFLAGERADPDSLKWAEASLNVPIRDHWWQTETGWPICSNLVGVDGYIPVKYGSTFTACPGYDVQVLNDGHEQVPPNTLGNIAIKLPLPPGALLTLYNSTERFHEAYFKAIPGYYDTGDAGYIDEDGYVYVMSRTDDVINVAGHRLSSGAMEEVQILFRALRSSCFYQLTGRSSCFAVLAGTVRTRRRGRGRRGGRAGQAEGPDPPGSAGAQLAQHPEPRHHHQGGRADDPRPHRPRGRLQDRHRGREAAQDAFGQGAARHDAGHRERHGV